MNKLVLAGLLAVVLAAGIGIGYVAKPAEQPVEHVVVAMDWVIHGGHTPFFVALDKGYYAQERLSVEILRGYGSADNVKRLFAKQVDLALIESSTMISALAKDPSIKFKMLNMYFVSPDVINFAKGGPVKEPKDLPGKSVALTPGANEFYRAFMAKLGLDPKTMKEVIIPPGAKATALAGGQVDVAVDYYSDSIIYADALSKAGKELGQFRLLDYGLGRYATGLTANEDYIKAKPDLLTRFMRATQKGWAWTIENPNEAHKILLKYSPENQANVKADIFRIEYDLSAHKDLPETSDKGLGYAVPEKWKSTYDLVIQYLKVTGAPPLEQLYTNEFISKIAPKK